MGGERVVFIVAIVMARSTCWFGIMTPAYIPIHLRTSYSMQIGFQESQSYRLLFYPGHRGVLCLF